ncbi:uncharacterized protein LOC124145153 [Haliotis rufescens]|uniref:uncharacterized protein LOC124145153 n=1 Tax=Haliotis rufescens TaxID=6454 RepID=UPI00201ED48E|nr:uncharacterized protein LOC124145153 [Haliotis rufescens]
MSLITMTGANFCSHTMLLLLIVMRTVTAFLETEADGRSSREEKQFNHILRGSSLPTDEASFESMPSARVNDRIISLLSKLPKSAKEYINGDEGTISKPSSVTPILEADSLEEDVFNVLRPRQDAEDEGRMGTLDGRFPLTPSLTGTVEKTIDALMLSLHYTESILSNLARTSKGHPVPVGDVQVQSWSRLPHGFNTIVQKQKHSSNLPQQRRFDNFSSGLTEKRYVAFKEYKHTERPFDPLANNLIGKRGVFSVDAPYKRRPFDPLANNLIGKRGVFSVDVPYKRRPFDPLANNLIGKRGVFSVDVPYKRRPFDPLANNLIGKRGVFSVDEPHNKRPFDPLANGLIGKRGVVFPFHKSLLKRPFNAFTGKQYAAYASSTRD